MRQQRASIARIVEGCAPLKRFQHVLFAHERGPDTKLPDDAVRYAMAGERFTLADIAAVTIAQSTFQTVAWEQSPNRSKASKSLPTTPTTSATSSPSRQSTGHSSRGL
jgi:hypothetical protein